MPCRRTTEEMIDEFCGQRGDRVLFVGEGNFSFSLALAKLALDKDRLNQWTSTCYESKPVSEKASENAAALKGLGVSVAFGVDATKIDGNYDRVVFMFPHVGGKMKIQKNRRLLRHFSASAATAIADSDGGRVVVTLCAGQGGTDRELAPRSSEADTWQIVKMMADSGLQLVDAKPLASTVAEMLPDYASFGYRSLDKGFHTENAVVHVFALNSFDGGLDFVQKRLKLLSRERRTCEVAVRLATLLGPDFEVDADHDEGHGAPDLKRYKGTTIPRVLLSFDFSLELGSNPVKVFVLTRKVLGSLKKACAEGDVTAYNATEHCFDSFDESWQEMWTELPSVSPASYSHDLSFWSREDLAIADLRKLVWLRCGDFVSSFEVIDDTFVGADSRRSYTVRIVYKTHAFALGPETAYDLHRKHLGAALVDKFGVELR